LAHPQTTITRGALGGLAEAGAVVVVCDETYMPISMALPLAGFHAPARRMAAQIEATLPVRKRLWQQIVRAKILAQAALLEQERGNDFGLRNMAGEVKSGDPENLEGQAARVYWQSIFDDPSFQRRTDVPNQNRYLNYGYAVVRAVTARAICATGLHPGLGIHHHHRENAFCLADDLMEPFRPAADELALGVLRDFGPDAAMDKKIKPRLIDVVNARFAIEGEERSLFDCAARLAASVAAVFEGQAERAIVPEF
jgi:CRISPR-associated protein Cas1